METNSAFSINNSAQNRAVAKRIPRFLEECYQMLDKGNFKEYVDWNKEGTSILIKDPNQFAEKVLPVYFKHNNLASFIRQLNMYDFKKQKHPHYNYIFGHDSFRKGEKGLLKNILRKSSSEYLRYQEKKRRREETARMLAQTSKTIKDPESIYIENNILRHNQAQLEAEITNLNQQVVHHHSMNADLTDKYENLKHEGAYLIRMINALTAKLGQETIFSIIQNQMYHTEEDSKHDRQPSNLVRNFTQSDSLVKSHACASNDLCSGKADQVLSDERKRGHFVTQENWELDTPHKKAKVDSKNPSRTQHEQQKANATRIPPLIESFQQIQHDYPNLHDDKELELKGIGSEF